jgi:hypothetical protein
VKALTLEGIHMFTTPQQIVETLDNAGVVAGTNATLAGVNQLVEIYLVDRHRLGGKSLISGSSRRDLVSRGVVVFDLLR